MGKRGEIEVEQGACVPIASTTEVVDADLVAPSEFSQFVRVEVVSLARGVGAAACGEAAEMSAEEVNADERFTAPRGTGCQLSASTGRRGG